MYKITLITTGHREIGNCNSNELYKIIEQLDPDIIFEEHSPVGFAAIYQGPRADTLETYAIKFYLQKRLIAHIPVDLDGNDLMDVHLKKEIVAMFNLFKDSRDYIDLKNQHHDLAEQLGFPYLNSGQCMELLKRTHMLEEVILKIKNQEKWFQIYKDWLEIIDRRENEMINNIYNYSYQNKYNKALFLIGAEHRESIIDKIPSFERYQKLKLNWIFDFLN